MNYRRILKHFHFIRFIGMTLLALMIMPWASAESPATAESKSPGWGSHGMAVFGGREALYASHLPMFHAPHDTQVILRFHLQDSAGDANLRNALATHSELWTLEPEEFDLSRLAPGHAHPLQQFKARFVQGHFERGGKERFAGQTAIIDEVILFHRLSMVERTHTDGRYHVIGKASERFLVKEIDRRPDFDLILALKPSAKLNRSLTATVSLPSDNLVPPSPTAWRQALQRQLGSDAELSKILYVETEDLKM